MDDRQKYYSFDLPYAVIARLSIGPALIDP
ncbi:hypothetical protein L902_29845 [Agrobacterium radiobacter DSM 30147]|nr:hypothetical protein L902_29845 [Agrobacterium radiobacter DSM 30147]